MRWPTGRRGRPQLATPGRTRSAGRCGQRRVSCASDSRGTAKEKNERRGGAGITGTTCANDMSLGIEQSWTLNPVFRDRPERNACREKSVEALQALKFTKAAGGAKRSGRLRRCAQLPTGVLRIYGRRQAGASRALGMGSAECGMRAEGALALGLWLPGWAGGGR